jgi:hypothetical protein
LFFRKIPKKLLLYFATRNFQSSATFVLSSFTKLKTPHSFIKTPRPQRNQQANMMSTCNTEVKKEAVDEHTPNNGIVVMEPTPGFNSEDSFIMKSTITTPSGPSAADLKALRAALSGTADKNSPKVWYFYRNDTKAVKTTTDLKEEQDPVTEKKSKKTKTVRVLKKDGRRRTLAYVWVGGLVFYGGSVYNPKSSTTAVARRTLQTGLEGIIRSLFQDAPVRLSLEEDDSKAPAWNKKSERSTAEGRLEKRPVVFRTNATSHHDVREAIMQHVFQDGVCGPRLPIETE